MFYTMSKQIKGNGQCAFQTSSNHKWINYAEYQNMKTPIL